MGLVREEVSSRRRDRAIDHRLETYERNESPPLVKRINQLDHHNWLRTCAVQKAISAFELEKSVKLLTLQCDFVGRSGDPALR